MHWYVCGNALAIKTPVLPHVVIYHGIVHHVIVRLNIVVISIYVDILTEEKWGKRSVQKTA
jgi:hypothetical protein